MKGLVILLAAIALTSCGDRETQVFSDTDRVDTYAPEQVPGGEVLNSVGELLGEYRVAGIDGGEVPGGEAIALSIDGPLVSYEPTCAGFVWEIDFEEERFETARHSFGPPPEPGEPPRPVCAIAVSAGQRALATAIDAATRAERTPANAIRLSGSGHSVLLFSQ